MSNDSQILESLCRLCKDPAETLTDHVCKNCTLELELSDKMQAKTIDLTKANNKATK